MPLLTLNVGARNDSYMGDFKWRFNTMLNFLGKSVAAIGRQADIEVRVIDWNSEVPLHRVLTLCPEADAITRFIVVPPEIAVPAQRDAEFPIPIVLNVGLRRARGEFIGATDSDVLFTPASLYCLFALLDGRIPGGPLRESLLVSWRRHLPTTQVARQPRLQELQEYISRNHSLLPSESPHDGTGAPAAYVMMHRDRWSECRGYDEKYIHWGWMDVDLSLRVTQLYPLMYLNNFGVDPVHLEHYRRREYDKDQTRKFNRPNDTPQFVANDEDWGLAAHTFACHRAENVRDVDADPPERWVLTAAEGKQGMEDPAVAAGVETLLRQFPFPIHPVERFAMRLLGWYASTRHPQVYVETEMRQPHAACVVAKFTGGVEVYAAVSWERLPEEETFYANRDDACATFFTAHCLREGGQQLGYCRLITGDPATAIQRLIRSHPARFGVDLALVRSAPHAPQQAMELAECLKPGGALVVTSPDMPGFEAMWKPLCQRFPQRAFIQITGHSAGMMLDAIVK